MKLVSCIIPAFNCEPWLQRAVESVLQTGYPSLEVVIVDDGSTDNTLQVARSLSAAHPQSVRWMQHTGGINRGVSAARNLGMQGCHGEWICFLDADDYVYPHRFRVAAKILQAQPDVDGVHELARMEFLNDHARQQWPAKSEHFGFEQPIAPADLLGELLKGQCWATSAILFRKSLLERCGLFHEGLRIAEDCHLWFRMATVGKLVSGEIGHPVSAYSRRTESAYQPAPTQKLQMIRAMLSFLHWLRSDDVPRIVRTQAKQQVQRYIQNGLVQSRFARQRKLAWAIAGQGLRHMPSLSFDPAFMGQLLRLALGR